MEADGRTLDRVLSPGILLRLRSRAGKARAITLHSLRPNAS
jgi:hypothetical protein